MLLLLLLLLLLMLLLLVLLLMVLVVVFIGEGESLDLKALGGANERSEVCLRNINLAAIHEIEERLEVSSGYVLEEDDGVLARCFRQHLTEVFGARGENELMRRVQLPTASQRHIHEHLLQEKGTVSNELTLIYLCKKI